MPKVITLRLSDEAYNKISAFAQNEHRPISNYITAVVLHEMEDSLDTDAIETAQVLSDKKLLHKLSRGHEDARKRRGKLVA